jgi:pimeloyl-ACP methyl ester carboxylesterase
MPAPPKVLRTLARRFDPTAFDAPSGRARLRLEVAGEGAWDALAGGERLELEPADPDQRPDARLSADRETWEKIAADVRGGMEAFRSGGLTLRDDLHLGVGFLAATSGLTEPGRLEVARVATRGGDIALYRAGRGDPVVMLPGLGGTKASFLPTIAALADRYRVLAIDLPGFGDSAKPLTGAYDAPFFARSVVAFLDACDIDRAHLIGNSMGGRVALEVGFAFPERTGRLALLAPSLAWMRERPWAGVVRALRPELGLLQVAPRGLVEELVRRFVPGGRDGWSAVGVDEFLRGYLKPSGRRAFYAALRNIYLEEPDGPDGFWPRLRELQAESLFVWGRHDPLVPIGFARHVREALPAAEHLELSCGHVPQLERPRQTHAAVRDFLGRAPLSAAAGGAARRAAGA